MRQWHCNPHPTQGWDLTARNVCNNCGGTSNEEEGFTSSAVFHEVGIGYRQTAVVSLNHLLGFRWQVQSKTAEKNQGSRKGSTTSGMLWQNPASGSGRCGSNVCHTQTATCQVCSPPTLHTKALHLSSKSWILLKVSQGTLNGRPTWKRASFYCIGRSQSWANWETKQSNTFKPPINESAAE